ncbi:MAG: T9SS type A sorting domain-containing protein, partial [Flavobacteriales bacterium]|nr:T9SS type A sorting domain-containing protein [Flavobacteriales bacterium]
MLPDIDTTDGSTVTKSYYGPCYDSVEVVLYSIDNGGHTWPGAFPFQQLGNTNQDFNASAEIWKFFSKYQLNTNSVVINIEETTIMEIRGVTFPNPSNGLFEISLEANEKVQPTDLWIYNSLGQLVYEHSLKEPEGSELKIQVDLTCQTSGIYLISVSTSSVSLFSQRIIIR